MSPEVQEKTLSISKELLITSVLNAGSLLISKVPSAALIFLNLKVARFCSGDKLTPVKVLKSNQATRRLLVGLPTFA